MKGGSPGLKVAGKALCVVGALLLAFVGFQLWGTALSEHSAQTRLRTELEAQLHSHRSASRSPTTVPATGDGSGSDTLGSKTESGSTAVNSPAVGLPVGLLSIPRIGLNDDVIIEGVGTDQLRQGPGHYPDTPLPGEPGNVAIAGHRTTYGAPFYNLNELQSGDPIVIQTVQGTFHYRVIQSSTVAPTDSAVLDSTVQSELTLTTCNPRYSATQRLVVVALLQNSHPNGVLRTAPAHPPKAIPKSETRVAATTLADGGGNGSIAGAVLWGLLTAVASLGVWVLWRRTRSGRRWGVLTVGTPVVLAALFVFFSHVSAALPASF